MRALIDFFTLRPVFTMWGLRLIWLLVLAQQAVGIASAFSSYGSFVPWSWFRLPVVFLFFNIALHLVLVRLLIEVAAAILLRPPRVETSD